MSFKKAPEGADSDSVNRLGVIIGCSFMRVDTAGVHSAEQNPNSGCRPLPLILEFGNFYMRMGTCIWL